MTAPLFHLHQVQVRYGERLVLQGVSLDIRAGEKVALIGRSGSGKSTLLRTLYPLQAAQTAWCPQELGLVGPLSVYHNIYMGRLDRHNFLYNALNLLRPWPAHWRDVQELARPLGLDEQLRQVVDSLSGGQKQRTALARALYQERPIFCGDEPVSSVDPLQARALLELINARHETVVVALHDVTLALACYDRVVGLQDGRVVLDAPAHQLSPDDLTAVYQDAP